MNKAIFTRTFIAAAIACGATGSATAQVSGYAMDSRGAVVKSGFGLCWRTGYWTPAMATPECDPELARKPVAPAPAAKAAPAPEKMALSADGLFDFGKSTLKKEGMAKLDDLAARLKGKKIDKLTVTGHTDRFGSAAFNQKLSQKRADAVKDYLAGKGVDKSKISAEGKGSAQPKTTAKQCEGKKSAKVVACLAPDRRVELEALFSK